MIKLVNLRTNGELISTHDYAYHFSLKGSIRDTIELFGEFDISKEGLIGIMKEQFGRDLINYIETEPKYQGFVVPTRAKEDVFVPIMKERYRIKPWLGVTGTLYWKVQRKYWKFWITKQTSPLCRSSAQFVSDSLNKSY